MLSLIDTNLIVYALNTSSPKNKKSQSFIKENRNILCLAHQNILEALRVLTHPKFSSPMSPKKANMAVWGIADALKLITPNEQTIYLAKEFVTMYDLKADEIFDAYLVATAVSNQIEIVVTDNEQHLKKYKGIKVLNPF